MTLITLFFSLANFKRKMYFSY